MLFFSIHSLILTFGLQLYAVHCWPLTPETAIRSLHSLNLTLPILESGGLLNTSMLTYYPIEWHIGGTTMTLFLDPKPKGYLSAAETTALLTQVRKMSDEKAKTIPVGGAFWYQDPSNHEGPRFGIRRAPYLNELTWGDVSPIVSALLGYYERYEIWLETAFGIEDSERGAIGSGIVERGKPEGYE